MKMLHVLQRKSKYGLFLAALAMFLTGCGSNSPQPPTFTLEDRANIVSTSMRTELTQQAQKLNTSVQGELVILTLPEINSTEPSGFADDAFSAAPYFGPLLDKTKLPDEKQDNAVRKEWAKRGVLICASVNPRLVFVRVGTDFRNYLNDTELQGLMEQNVYPLLMKKQLRAATNAAAIAVEQNLQQQPQAIQEPSFFSSHINAALLELKQFSFPKWPVYYYLFNPLLNSLVLAMKLTGYTIWGVVLWLFVLQLLTKRDWVYGFWYSFNWAMWKRTGLLKWWLLRGQKKDPWQGEIHYRNRKTGKDELKLTMGRSHEQVVDARMAALERNIPFIADMETSLTKLGLGLPVWAALSLITLPFWENILTMRNHLEPWVQSGLSSHSVFVLQNGAHV